MSERTKRDIVLGFNSLIKKMDFEEITMDKIAKETGVSRSTIYRYFSDKYEIMNYNYKKMLDSCFNIDESETLEDVFYALFKDAKDNWQPLYRIFETTGVNSINTFIAEYSYQVAHDAIVKKTGREFTPAEEMQLHAFCGGASYNYAKWVHGDYGKLSVKDAAYALYQLVPEQWQGNIW